MIDKPRFLILPRVRDPDHGSDILSLICRRLPEDWTARHGITAVLCETFPEVPCTLLAGPAAHRDGCPSVEHGGAGGMIAT